MTASPFTFSVVQQLQYFTWNLAVTIVFLKFSQEFAEPDTLGNMDYTTFQNRWKQCGKGLMTSPNNGRYFRQWADWKLHTVPGTL